MSKTKISIHRALTELKVIDDRIRKKIEAFSPVGIYKKDKKVNEVHTVDEFNKQVKSSYESIDALIDRKFMLKSLIAVSNSITKVVILGNEVTVTEAIVIKDIIEQKRFLRNHISKAYNHSLSNIEQINTKVDKNALSLGEAAVGGDKDNLKKNEVEAIMETYIENNKVRLADPLDVVNEISKIDKKINDFADNIDSVLSESNATTFIEL